MILPPLSPDIPPSLKAKYSSIFGFGFLSNSKDFGGMTCLTFLIFSASIGLNSRMPLFGLFGSMMM